MERDERKKISPMLGYTNQIVGLFPFGLGFNGFCFSLCLAFVWFLDFLDTACNYG
jgi:hypothetical protein